jgi:ABC-2 type transport system ATP-binding protein
LTRVAKGSAPETAARATPTAVGAAAPVVRFEKVSRSYGPVLALNEITLSVGPGIHGLVGPNGAGKSTTVRLVAGLLRPGLGTVRVFGEDPFANPAVARRLGYAPETEAHYDGLPARKFLLAMAALSGVPASAARWRSDEALERVGLTRAATTRLGAMSRGMRQRMKLAQAVLHDPELLVLDEPLSGMDPVARRASSDLLRRLGGEGRTILVSSHVLHEVEALADRIYLLRNGRLFAEGTVREIRSLLIRHPLRIRVETPRARVLAAEAAAWEEVLSVRIEDEARRLTFEVARADRFLERMGELAEGGFPIEALDPVDESLEAVFRYLVIERAGAGGGEGEG